jgi:hypothetical protein
MVPRRGANRIMMGTQTKVTNAAATPTTTYAKNEGT